MGQIILPNRELVVPNQLHMHAGMAGKYRMRITKARTGKLKHDTGWFNNLITNQGLINYNTMPNGSSFASGEIGSNCAVGTGTTTPSITDTGLVNYVTSIHSIATSDTGPAGPSATGYVAAAGSLPPYWYATYIYQFPTGSAAGNLTEVGVFPNDSSPSTTLTSRALILDDSGNPTAITVLSDEILTVTYQLRFYLDTADHSFTFNLGGTPITGTYRLCHMNSEKAQTTRVPKAGISVIVYSGALGALTSEPTGSLGAINVNNSSPTWVRIVNDIDNTGTMYGDVKGTFGVNTGNGTIRSFRFVTHMWDYQFGNLSQPIVKTTGQQLQVNFRASWGRWTP